MIVHPWAASAPLPAVAGSAPILTGRDQLANFMPRLVVLHATHERGSGHTTLSSAVSYW